MRGRGRGGRGEDEGGEGNEQGQEKGEGALVVPLTAKTTSSNRSRGPVKARMVRG